MRESGVTRACEEVSCSVKWWGREFEWDELPPDIRNGIRARLDELVDYVRHNNPLPL